ncbi:sialate O-acetylesterase [Jiulongibacter sp. NS-SX5]|uniref:sialate O-acetylesterase n=1 Tax=Jiulongibacter sp. NS-SX5 TaxID=3463854 RepID=UPI0040583035
MLRILTICLLTALLINSGKAQDFRVTLPEYKSVYQRNNENIGFVKVKLENLQQVDSISLAVFDRQSDWSHEYDLTSSISNQKVFTSIALAGGWYRFSFTFYSGGQAYKQEVSHVGVGEVFLVAGQSNAQREGPSPKDERVVGALFDGGRNGRPNFFSINTTEYKKWLWPSPPGTSFVGVLGDSLVNRLGVPVLFFNAAAGGTSSGDWYQSAIYNEPPYFYVDLLLHKFTFDLGMRGVLWLQGESNSRVDSYHPEAEVYQTQIQFMVDKMRDTLHFPEFNWVVSLTSWNKAGADTLTGFDPNPDYLREQTRNGQQLLIDEDQEIYQGPDTDVLEGYANSTLRSDGTHFTSEGFVFVGIFWNRSLSDQYFAQSKPYLGRQINIISPQNSQTEQFVTLEDWEVPSDCHWHPLPTVIAKDLPVFFSVNTSELAQIKGDSIQLTGISGNLELLVFNYGNEDFLPFGDTLEFELGQLVSKPQLIHPVESYMKGEVVELTGSCSNGQIAWYADHDLLNQLSAKSSLRFIYKEEDIVYANCENLGCVSQPALELPLNEKECETSDFSVFDPKEYFILDHLIRKIEGFSKESLINAIIENKLTEKVYLHESQEGMISMSFQGCQIN